MPVYQLKNGAELSGSIEQILTVAKTMGETVDVSKLQGEIPPGYYNSQTKGLVPIKELNSYHLRNALLKSARTFLTDLINTKELTHQEFLAVYLNMNNSVHIAQLLEELKTRNDNVVTQKPTADVVQNS